VIPGIAVFGAGGQVGSALARRARERRIKLTLFTRAEADVTDYKAVIAALRDANTGIAINAAAYTAVDKAESEPERAHAINRDGAANLAQACATQGIQLIHISTDYVFDGTKKGPYREDDPIKPLGVYGASKEAGERVVRRALREHIILRTAWVYSAHGHNFVKTMLRLAGERPVLRVVADQTGSPTAAADIAGAIAAIVQCVSAGNAAWGTYHFTGDGAVTWHGFARAIFEGAEVWRGPPPRVEAIATADFPTPARRPANSVLDCARIGAAFGVVPRPWRAALADTLAELGLGA
jgi:dTDP-4-dehydrorhamnose reductase